MPKGVYIRTEFHRDISRVNGAKQTTPWNKGIKTGIQPTNAWVKGSKPQGGFNTRFKITHDMSRTKEYWLAIQHSRRALKSELGIKTVQMVYEDNIKQYGTLTCYLCTKPIEFGKDELEHKTPLSRGGNNEYSNLGIACRRCNRRKHNKTVAEYRKE